MAWIFIDAYVACMGCVVYISVLVVVLGSCEQIFTALGTALGNIHTHRHTQNPHQTAANAVFVVVEECDITRMFGNVFFCCVRVCF